MMVEDDRSFFGLSSSDLCFSSDAEQSDSCVLAELIDLLSDTKENLDEAGNAN